MDHQSVIICSILLVQFERCDENKHHSISVNVSQLIRASTMRGAKNGSFYYDFSIEEWLLPYTPWNRDRLNSIWIWMMVLLSHQSFRMCRLHWNYYSSVLHRCIPIRWSPSNCPLWESSLMTLYSVLKRQRKHIKLAQQKVSRTCFVLTQRWLPVCLFTFKSRLIRCNRIDSSKQTNASLMCAFFSAHGLTFMSLVKSLSANELLLLSWNSSRLLLLCACVSMLLMSMLMAAW